MFDTFSAPIMDNGFTLGSTLGTLYGDAFQPESTNAGASSWTDVLKLGINRVADYKIATVTPQNAGSRIAPSSRAVSASSATTAAAAPAGFDLAGLLPVLVIVGLVLAFAPGR